MQIPDRTRHPLAVLVVDDSPDAAESLAEVLELHGHAVRVAFTGAGALQSVSAQVPDVVFLDILMPGSDGTRSPSGFVTIALAGGNRCSSRSPGAGPRATASGPRKRGSIFTS